LVGEAGGRYEFSFRHMPSEASLTTTGWGSLNDLREVVRLAKRGSLKWHVERMPLADAAVAHDRLAEGRVSGRIVLMPQSES
jgi:propanol-preferring alcohol dehydrogenase